jgi:hypothetical protein
MGNNFLCKLQLNKGFFSEKEKLVLENGELKVSAFTYDTGVYALRIKNLRGELILLPYQGQQIWDAIFDDRRLTMKSMFDKPVSTQDFLATYGGFLLHCGATAMGTPSKEDNHPQHGELPNAPYQKAYVDAGIDEKGKYIGLGGEYEHVVAYQHHYLAAPYLKVYEDAAVISVKMSITNLKHTEMELMYLMHINFIPVVNSDIIYSAINDREHIKTHINIPTHIVVSDDNAKLIDFMKQMEENPGLHHKLLPDMIYDPEICYTIKYEADENGYSYSLQKNPDGYSHYVRHRPQELPYVIRWISITPDQEAMGLALPATAEHLGYTDAKKKNQLKVLRPFETMEFNCEAGLLRPEETDKTVKRIIEILNKKK